MGWSLSYKNPPDFSMVDATLLAVGKAVYLANAFEYKCQYVLQVANLVSCIQAHPEASFSEALASVAREHMLNLTIKGLRESDSLATTQEIELLDRARNARNFIAHEGAQFGYVFDATDSKMLEHLSKLRPVVADLAAGDNVVSRWVYEIEEKSPAPVGLIAEYPSMVDRWVFGHLKSPLWKGLPGNSARLSELLSKGESSR